MKRSLVFLAALMPGCSQAPTVETFTLYRNSPFGVLRVHFATFDASDDAPGLNRDSCEMSARLLNANVNPLRRANGEKGDSDVGFWCEPGRFKAEGSIAGHFEAKFPTDV